MRTTLGLLAIGIAFVVWNRVNARLFRDGFSPLHLMFFSWVLPLSLRGLHLSGLEEPWSSRTVAALLYVTTAMAFVSAGAVLLVRRDSFPARRHVFARTLRQFRDADFTILLLAVWLGVFAVYVYVEFVTNPVGIPLFSRMHGADGLGNAHRWGKDTRWAAITTLLYVLTPMMYLAFRAARNRFAGALFLVAALLFPVAGFFKLSRSDMFVSVLTMSAVELYYRKYRAMRFQLPKLSPFKWAVLSAAVVAFLGLTLRLRLKTADYQLNYAEEIRFRWREGLVAEAFSQLYGYLALPFENFHRFFSSYGGSFRPGVSVLRPFLAAVGRGDVADRLLEDVYFDSVSQAAGSHTFLPHVYVEFGLVGIVIVPVVYAVFINAMYVAFRHRPTPARLFLYVAFLFPWCWLFFNNAFSVLSFYINAAFVVTFMAAWELLRPPVGRLPRVIAAP